MLRVVLDTSVIASALRSRRGASFSLLNEVQEARLTMLASPALFLEYEAVIKRPDQRRVSGLSLADIDDLLAALAGLIEPVAIRILWRPQLSDPGDEHVLEAAINGQADALVSHNVRDFAGATQRFGVRLLRPGDLLKELPS